MMARAMAFAKYRAANAGMGAAMAQFSAIAQAEEDDTDNLSTAASQVIKVIRNCESSN